MKELLASPSRRFALIRVLFGAYLTLFSVLVIPHARGLYTPAGMIRSARGGNVGYLPTFLLSFDSVRQVTAILVIKAVACLLFTFGVARRASALVAVALLIWTVNRNFWTNTPEHPYVIWLLLMTVFVPTGESLRHHVPGWRVPRAAQLAAWFIGGIGYSYSAWTKFDSPTWVDGTALGYFLGQTDLPRPWVLTWVHSTPSAVLEATTYTALTLELIGLCVFIRPLRVLYGVLMLGFNVTILCLMHITELTLGMILFHTFLLACAVDEGDLAPLKAVWSRLKRLRPSKTHVAEPTAA